MTTEKGSLLDNFDWSEGDNDFFGEPQTTEKTEIETQPTTEDEDNADKVVEELKKEEDKKGDKKETAPNFDFEEGEEEEQPVELNDSDYKTLYTKLKEKGVLTVDAGDEEIDEDKFLELQEQEIDERVDETIKGFFEELPEEGTAYLKFIKAGGSSKDFFEVLKNSAANFDIASERGQEEFLRNYHKRVDDWDDEDIDDAIERYKEKGTLQRYAEKYHGKEKEKEQARLKNLEKQAEAQKQAVIEQQKVFSETLKTLIEDSTEVKGWKLNKADKKELHSFITKPTIKVGNNKYKTQFQDTLQKVFQDKEKMILLAKILKSDFSLDEIEREKETAVAKKAKQEIQNKEKTPNLKGGGDGKKSKGLSDYF